MTRRKGERKKTKKVAKGGTEMLRKREKKGLKETRTREGKKRGVKEGEQRKGGVRLHIFDTLQVFSLTDRV